MLEEPLIANRYRLADLIGSGGEARVFRARDLQEERDVAMRLPLGAQEAASPVSPPKFHSGWVQLLGSGTDPLQGPYQVLELLEGETLRQQVQKAPLDDEAWRTFIQQSLDAVEALHEAGWVHGDLNSENFLRTASSWKLLELPFLRLAPPRGRSAAFGSIHSIAPEQLQGQPADSRSDLYALGCLYYYAAAGEYPHAGGTRQEIAISLLRFPPTPLQEKSPARPRASCDGVMALLERDPQKRCPSIAAARRLLSDLP